MKTVVVAHEKSDAIQAMYVDGRLVACDDTIYVSVIVEHIGSEPITISQEEFDLPELLGWPETLDELREMQTHFS